MSFLKHDKPLIRRTFLQERFIILIERQQSGQATFAELTELDEIVNRDPKLTNIILEEMEEDNTTINTPGSNDVMYTNRAKPQPVFEKIKAFINHLLRYSVHPMQTPFI